MAVTTEPPWLNKSAGTAARNGTTSHTVPFGFTAGTGTLLVVVMFGAVTHAATGWTERLQPVNSGELSVFTKTGAGETGITVTHNGSNYPVQWVAYEFPSGSTYTAGIGNSPSAMTFPTLSSLPGTEQVIIASRGVTATATNTTGSTVWSAPWVSDFDDVEPQATTDGAYMTVAHQINFTGTSITPTATTTTNSGTPDREHVVFAINAAAVGGGSSYSGSVGFTLSESIVGSGGPAIAGSVALGATGSLTAAGTPSIGGSTVLAAVEAFTVSGTPRPSGSVAFTASETLQGSGTPRPTGSVSMSASESLGLSGSAGSAFSGSVALGASSAIALSGSPAPAGSVAFTEAESLALSGVPRPAGSVSLGASEALTVAGTPRPVGAVGLGAVEVLAGAGQPGVGGTLALTASEVLTTSGSVLVEAHSGGVSFGFGESLSMNGAPSFGGLRNLITNPNLDRPGGSIVTSRWNYSTNPGAISGWNTRWWGGSGATGTYTYLTGSGIVGGPDTFVRKSWTTNLLGGSGDTGLAVTQNAANGYPISPGVHTISAWMRTNQIGRLAHISATFYTSADVLVQAATVSPNFAIGATWTRLSYTVTAPATTGKVLIILDVDLGGPWAAGSTLDGTGVLVEASSYLEPYFDGNTAPVGDATYVWAGTVGLSVSAEKRPAVGGITTIPSQVYAFTVDNGEGGKAWRSRVNSVPFGLNYNLPTNVIALGETMTLLIRARANVSRTIKMRISGTQAAAVTLTTSWAYYRVKIVPTVNNGSTGFLGESVQGWVTGDWIDIDEILVVRGDYDGPFFDGDTAGARWEGVVSTSTSIYGMPSVEFGASLDLDVRRWFAAQMWNQIQYLGGDATEVWFEGELLWINQ